MEYSRKAKNARMNGDFYEPEQKSMNGPLKRWTIQQCVAYYCSILLIEDAN